MGKLLERVKNLVSDLIGPWKPTALAICALVIAFCSPTLKAVSQRLANDIVNPGKEMDPFAGGVSMITNHTLLVLLALLCVVLVVSAIALVIVIIIAEIARQIRRARGYLKTPRKKDPQRPKIEGIARDKVIPMRRSSGDNS